MPRRFLRLLSLGTSFIPTDTRTLKRQVELSLEKFQHSLAWAHMFGWSRRANDEAYPLFRAKSGASDPELSPSVATYLERLKKLLVGKFDGLKHKRSFFIKEIEAFHRWAKDDYVVKPSDKNLGLAIMTSDYYESLCNQYLIPSCLQVEDRSEKQIVAYLRYQIDLLLGAAKQKCWVSEEVATWLLESEAQASSLPAFYVLPKLHKSPVAPRPIVAAHSCPLSACSKWLGKVVQPVLSVLPAYLRDSGHLVELIVRRTFPKDCWLLTYDISSMYPNMKLEQTLESLDFVLRRAYNGRLPSWAPLCRGIVHLLFEECYMTYAGKIFKQREGIAMGTNAAPNLANAYLSPWEVRFSCDDDVLLYKRFIDDGFAVVRSKERALGIIRTLQESGLEFNFQVSQASAIFLDLEISKGPLFDFCGLLQFKTYRKAMNRFLYLPAFSAHHPANIRSWIYAEILRIRNTTLLDSDFDQSVRFFLYNLARRGYGSSLVQQAIDMLPRPLLSPLVRSYTERPVRDLVDNSGQVYETAPPKVFRAPYALHLRIPYGSAVHHQLEDIVHQLDNEAGRANPSPLPQPLVVIANTHQKSLKSRLVKSRPSSSLSASSDSDMGAKFRSRKFP